MKLEAIRGARIVTMRPDEPEIGEGDLHLAADGTIAEISRAAGKAGGADFDARGLTVVPGLIDMHVHVLPATERELESRDVVSVTTNQTLRAAWQCSASLDAGVTTVRDVGAATTGINDIARAIRDRRLGGPRLIHSGQAICITGGHVWGRMAIEADGPFEMARAARQQMKLGADWVKLMVTGGAGTLGEEIDELQITLEEMKAVTAEARRKGKRVSAHIGSAEATCLAVEAGIDTIEHGVLLDERAVAMMVEAGSYLCPTIAVYDHIINEGPALGYPGYMVEKAAAVFSKHHASFRMALEAGVRMIAGTDGGPSNWPLGLLARELEWMVRLGMDTRAALASATSTAAECLGLGDEIGAIAPGMAADLLIVRGDPLQDISALGNVVAVVRAGRLVRWRGMPM